MSIKNKPPRIPFEPGTNPFENCKLGREKYGKILTEIVGTYADGFVMALDNKWGTGKTTFVNMWQQQLSNEGFKTLYFNAWEHDFDDKPLPAILAELKTLLGDDLANETFKELVDAGAVFLKKLGPLVLKILANKLGLGNNAEDLFKALGEGFTEVLQDDINEYTKKKKGLIDFKNKLEKFISEKKGDKPVVFIIDELDRCRPDYAVQVLEQIKHFFAVPGIVFVLSIDKEQLGHAIRGYYGSDLIEADEYLRRFIDLEYKLPTPLLIDFCNKLSDDLNFHDFFESPIKKQMINSLDQLISFNLLTSRLYEGSLLTLRQVEKLYSQMRVIISRLNPNIEIYPEILAFLIYCQIFKPDFFNLLIESKLSAKSFDEEFMKTIPKIRNKTVNYIFLRIEAGLLYLNESQFTQHPSETLLHKDGDGTFYTNLATRLGFNNHEFGSEIAKFRDYLKFKSEYSFKYLLERIKTFGELNT